MMIFMPLDALIRAAPHILVMIVTLGNPHRAGSR